MLDMLARLLRSAFSAVPLGMCDVIVTYYWNKIDLGYLQNI